MSAAIVKQDASHDFDFFVGRWRILNHRLVERLNNSDVWEDFEATCECRLILNGLGNMDEFRTDYWPDFVGMSIRFFNTESPQWSIYWVDNRSVILQPPVVGGFSDGVDNQYVVMSHEKGCPYQNTGARFSYLQTMLSQ